jgi:hypothetical protein
VQPLHPRARAAFRFVRQELGVRHGAE